MERGYIKLWRKIEDSAVFEDAHVFQLFCWLLMNVSRRSRQMLSGNVVQAGSLTTSFASLAERFGCSKSTIHHRLHLLENLGVISLYSERGFTVVTICNWTTYQSQEDASRTEAERKPNDSRTIAERKPNVEQEGEKVRRREGEKKKRARPSDENELPAEEIPLPPELDRDAFPAVWREWIKRRRKERWSVREGCMRDQLKALQPLGAQLAAECLQISMRNGWQGIFPDKVKPNGRQRTIELGAGQAHGGKPAADW